MPKKRFSLATQRAWAIKKVNNFPPPKLFTFRFLCCKISTKKNPKWTPKKTQKAPKPLQNLHKKFPKWTKNPLQNLYQKGPKWTKNPHKTSTKPLHNLYITSTKPLHNLYITSTKPLQNLYKTST